MGFDSCRGIDWQDSCRFRRGVSGGLVKFSFKGEGSAENFQLTASIEVESQVSVSSVRRDCLLILVQLKPVGFQYLAGPVNRLMWSMRFRFLPSKCNHIVESNSHRLLAPISERERQRPGNRTQLRMLRIRCAESRGEWDETHELAPSSQASMRCVGTGRPGRKLWSVVTA